MPSPNGSKATRIRNSRSSTYSTASVARARENVDPYQFDAQQAALVQKVAAQFATPLLLIHHDRKAAAEDWLEKISGTLGTAGTADCVMLLERKRDSENGRLRITGRDIEERDLGLDFKQGIWQFIGAGALASLSPERRKIFDAVLKSGPMSPADIALATGLTADSVRHTVLKMDDCLKQRATGVYEAIVVNSDNALSHSFCSLFVSFILFISFIEE